MSRNERRAREKDALHIWKERADRKARNEPLVLASIQDVLLSLEVPENFWDAVIVGDGSGCSWDRPCGWSAVLIEKNSGRRSVFTGGMSCGTNNISELMPYLQVLLWMEDRIGIPLRKQLRRKLRVHIITDSQLIANQGSHQAGRACNRPIWAAIDQIARDGYELYWHWVGRDRLGLNQLTDHLSRCGRESAENVKLPAGLSPYDFNSSATSLSAT